MRKVKDKKNIVLIGMTGSFKTTAGKIIAEKLGYDFFDADDEIVKKYEQRPIPQIFYLFGEHGFRDRETNVIKKLSKKKGVVISCGGGAVLRDKNMKVLKKKGMIVQLYADPEILHARISGDKNRPVTNGKTAAELESLYKIRKPLYDKYGEHKIDNSSLSPEQTADEVLRKYGSRRIKKG